MRKRICLLLLLLSVVYLSGCGEKTGEEKPVYTIASSEVYSEEEITVAMDALTKYFNDHSENCTLKEIIYEEELTLEAPERYADFVKDSGNEDIIILTAVYERGEVASGSDLLPEKECVNHWAMLRTNGRWSYFDDLGVYQEGIDHSLSQ